MPKLDLIFAAEVSRVISVLPAVEWGRRSKGPAPLLTTLRRRVTRMPARLPAAREALRRAIRWVDARVPGGPNCYRRALLEIALDAGAAREPLHLALRAHGGVGSGHAWLGAPASPEDRAAYDACFSV